MPKPLPLPRMLAHRPVMLANSPALRVDGVNGVSVVAYAPAVGVAWSVVPQAAMPLTIPAAVAVAALLVQLVPLPAVPASVASSFTVTEVGTTPVRVFTVRSRLTPRFTV